MKRFALGLVVGVSVVALAGGILWLVLPIASAAFTLDSEVWLPWLPFMVLPPALTLGGYIAGTLVQSRRIALAYCVGATTATLAMLLMPIGGQVWFLLLIVLASGGVSSVGATFVRARPPAA